MTDAVRPPSTREQFDQPGEIDLETYRDLTLEEQAALGTELDGVQIVHRRERFPVPGTKAEKRAERAVAACFVLAFLAPSRSSCATSCCPGSTTSTRSRTRGSPRCSA
jgi:hypothetical protein